MIYFSSDHHFWHSNILKYQPNRLWHSVEEMNEGLIYNWNSVVQPEDTIYCLGDFSFAGRSVELYSSRLNGNKKILFGNHDPGYPANKHCKKAVKRGEPDYWKNFYEDHGWEVLPLIHTLDLPEIGLVNMCHFPYDNTDQRYKEYWPKEDGKYILHGHTHSLIKLRDKNIHVGVDAWDCTPVSLTQIQDLIKCNSN